MPDSVTPADLTLDVLIMPGGDAWCAVALDMSLSGCGATPEEALEDLSGAARARISFAIQHGALDSVFMAAEPRYFERCAGAKRRAIQRRLGLIVADGDDDVQAVVVPVPERALAGQLRPRVTSLRPLAYRVVVRRLRDHDASFEVHRNPRQGESPDGPSSGQWTAHPVPYHGTNTPIRVPILKSIIRKFGLPADSFDS